MTIIEDAVKKLEAARAARRRQEDVDRVGTVINDSAEATDGSDDAHANGEPHFQLLETGTEPREKAAGAQATERSAEGEERPPTLQAIGAAAPDAPQGRLIAVDGIALRAAGLLPPENEEHRLINEFRNIKRPIVAHALGKRATKVENGRLIMVASALSGEGKTFTCINLALSIARERDLSVVLVDADVAKPHISRMFGVENETGLLDALDDPDAYDYKSLVIDTDIGGLSILPAGKSRPHATELLSSDRMESLLRAYRKDDVQRLVLFDSPPLLQTPEARVLAGLVGQIALVVRANVTPRHVVLDAISAIGEDKAVNLILNQARKAAGDIYYGGYHGYGYGYASGGSSPVKGEETID